MRRVMRFTFLMLAAAFAPALSAAGKAPAAADVLVPMPASAQELPGSYMPDSRIVIGLSDTRDARLKELGSRAAGILREAWHGQVSVSRSRGKGDVRLELAADPQANPESYTLQVDDKGITLKAPTHTGLFYGLQTLRQLAPPDAAQHSIAAVRIEDAPRFGYRGLMLDVARHMAPIEDIKRQLDLMARYKFNVFHWHLSDDQGWRIEIKRFPKLTSVGAWRRETMVDRHFDPYVGDGKRYGGFYTQAQAREIVEYAKKLHIEVIPEIDMPGHMVAALAAYPELGCTPGPFEVRTTWGVADDILCPSEKTFEFVTGVLAEVMDVFPSRYIHVGGDEAPTIRWEQSPLAQDIIRREGLKNEHALQGWFLRRVEAFVNAKGRKIIGWDEILDGDPSPTATVMSWRGMTGGIKAAQRGHDVIMAPVDHAYFDYCEGKPPLEPDCMVGHLPLKQVYAFEPVPSALTPEQAKHVLGGQANLWTEYISRTDQAQAKYWPRALAMADVLWAPRESHDWDGFLQRLGPQLEALGKAGVNYRIPDVLGLEADVVTLQAQAPLELSTPIPAAKILYTLDGSEPGAQSPVYSGAQSLDVTKPVIVSARVQLPDGRLGPVSRATYRQTALLPADTGPSRLKGGLQRDYYEVAVSNTDGLLALKPLRSDVAATVAIPQDARLENFGLRFQGWLKVPDDGLYRFVMVSDDGARLLIDGTPVIERDGYNSPGEAIGSVGLQAGLHRIELRFFQGGGGRILGLTSAHDGSGQAELPAEWLWH